MLQLKINRRKLREHCQGRRLKPSISSFKTYLTHSFWHENPTRARILWIEWSTTLWLTSWDLKHVQVQHMSTNLSSLKIYTRDFLIDKREVEWEWKCIIDVKVICMKLLSSTKSQISCITYQVLNYISGLDLKFVSRSQYLTWNNERGKIRSFYVIDWRNHIEDMIRRQ